MKCPREGRLEESRVDINPGTTRPEELGEQGTWWAGVCAAAIPVRDESTVEVAQQEGGGLHVQGVGEANKASMNRERSAACWRS